MHDKLLCPVFKLIHKPDGWAVLLELWLHTISIAGGPKKKKKKRLNLLYQAVNHKNLSWSTQLLLHNTGQQCYGGGNLCDVIKKKKERRKANTCTTLYDNFDTCVKNSDTKKRRDCVWVKRPNQLRRTVRNLLRVRSSTFRCCIDGASFQLSLPTRSAMGAHSWPLVFPWQTAISQSSTSPLCSHRSPYSPPCQNSLSGSSGNVGPLQVSAGVLCGLDTIQTTSACSRKRIRSLLFSNSKY